MIDDIENNEIYLFIAITCLKFAIGVKNQKKESAKYI
jgi:hypothetical protein